MLIINLSVNLLLFILADNLFIIKMPFTNKYLKLQIQYFDIHLNKL
jgi:hypothetical protein